MRTEMTDEIGDLRQARAELLHAGRGYHEILIPPGWAESRIRNVLEMLQDPSRHGLPATQGITTVTDLVARTEAEMLGVRHLGRKSVDLLKERLATYGLKLGMTEEEIATAFTPAADPAPEPRPSGVMRNPLYALLVAPSEPLRRAIALGEQTCSIREGHREYRTGPVLLGCPDVPWAVMADIVEVRHGTLGDVRRDEYVRAGFADAGDLEQGLRRYYPEIDRRSPVTVISWKHARGAPVDAARDPMTVADPLLAARLEMVRVGERYPDVLELTFGSRGSLYRAIADPAKFWTRSIKSLVARDPADFDGFRNRAYLLRSLEKRLGAFGLRLGMTEAEIEEAFRPA